MLSSRYPGVVTFPSIVVWSLVFRIIWPYVIGEYRGSASAEDYSFDGSKLNLSDKDQKWLGIRETFKFA